MKFRITMKDPVGVFDSITAEVVRLMERIKELDEGINADEMDSIEEQHRETLEKHVRDWFQYGEYITVEIDTDAKTCKVVKP